MHYAEFAEDESQALLNAIKDYENNKWKTIGQKVGKPAKVCLFAATRCWMKLTELHRPASNMRRSISLVGLKSMTFSHTSLANERGVQSCSVATRTASYNLLSLAFATSDEMYHVAETGIICLMNTRAGAVNRYGPSCTGFDTPPSGCTFQQF
jgi:hypothetical protein